MNTGNQYAISLSYITPDSSPGKTSILPNDISGNITDLCFLLIQNNKKLVHIKYHFLCRYGMIYCMVINSGNIN